MVAVSLKYDRRGLDAPPPPTTPFDYLGLAIPVYAMVQKWRNRSEFALLMSNLLGAGLGMIKSLEICARALPNGVFRKSVLKCRKRIEKEGLSMAECFSGDRALWPAEWIAAMEVAYESGEEDTILRRLGTAARESYVRAVKAAGVVFARLMYLAVSLYIVYQIIQLAKGYVGVINEAIGG